MSKETRNPIIPIIILAVLFFIFGFVTWLNGTLIPYLRIACELNTFQSLLVAFAFYISYFIMALPSSWVLSKTGFKHGMSLGLLIMACGAFLFIPAALNRAYIIFLSGLFVIGTGLSILQTASNPYITIVGPIESAARRISVMGICNKVAGVLAPIILGSIILSDADILVKKIEILDPFNKAVLLDELASRVIFPYVIIMLSLIFLAIMIRFSPLPEIESQQEELSEENNSSKNIFHHTNLILGVIALFLYVGAEVIAGDTIGTYGLSQGIPLSEAKSFTALTLSAMVIGYIIGIITIPRYISQSRALSISAFLGLLLTASAIFTKGYVSVFFIASLGLANAVVWPAIWPLAIDGLGRFTKTGSAMLIMAVAGGAVMPLLYGRLADISFIGARQAYCILFPAYLFILYYGMKGYKYRKQ